MAHGPALKTYFGVFLALMALTALTVAAAYMDLGAYGGSVALVIALTKATLVVLFFMHVRYESRLVALWAASGFVFLVLLFAMTFGEARARPPAPPDVLAPQPWPAPDAPRD